MTSDSAPCTSCRVKRGGPIARKTSLKRTWMKRRPKAERGKYTNRERDVEYMLQVKKLPCAARSLSPCSGEVEADHQVSSGAKGNKGPDDGCVPMCQQHHRDRGAFSGPFRTWNRPMMQVWMQACVANTRATLGRSA